MPQPIHDFFVALTYPPALSLCMLLAGILAAVVRWRRLALALVTLAFGWTLVWSIPWCSERLRATLEDRHVAVDERALPRADAIVVLGGGSLRWLMRADASEALASDHSRLAAGARAWLAGRAPLIVLSGGGNVRSEAELMAAAIERLGVPASALVLEERSRDTRDNARFTAALVAHCGVKRILLVTSSLHMPRAVVWFRRSGFEVVPVPVREPRSGPGWRAWLPNPHALWRSGRAMKEWAGLVVAHAGFQSPDLQAKARDVHVAGLRVAARAHSCRSEAEPSFDPAPEPASKASVEAAFTPAFARTRSLAPAFTSKVSPDSRSGDPPRRNFVGGPVQGRAVLHPPMAGVRDDPPAPRIP